MSEDTTSDNFKKLYVSYGSYHYNPWNKIIHIIFVPLLTYSVFCLLNTIPLVLGVAGVVRSVSLGIVLSTALCTYYMSIDLVSGGVSFIVYTLLALVARSEYAEERSGREVMTGVLHNIIIQIIGWGMQIIGHRYLEKRAPALTDDIFAVFRAQLFVVVEVMFFFGWRPKLRGDLKEIIKKNVRVFQDSIKRRS